MLKIFVLAILIMFVSFNHSYSATKNNAFGNSKEPIEISSDSLEVFQDEGKAIFKGKVDAKQGKMTLRSDTMTVFYRKTENSESSSSGLDSDNKISKIKVDGNVVLVTPTENAKSKRGEYDVEKGLITMNGNVVLNRNKNVLTGDSLTYDVNSGKSKIEAAKGLTSNKDGGNGRVKALFVPESKDKSQDGLNRE